MSERAAFVYKILTGAEWSRLEKTGQFAGSSADLRDGFVHLSTLEQLPGTLAKHFSGRSGLVLVEIASAGLGDALRWEVSRGGAFFPHLYRALEWDDVRLHSSDPSFG